MDTFKTRSTPRKQLRIVAVTFLVMAALAVLGLLISAAAFFFFEGILVLCWVFCALISRKTYFELEFRGEQLLLRNVGNRQSYLFESLRHSDFSFKQTERQKQQNSGDLKIQGTPFGICDVQRFDSLQDYIRHHFH